MDTKQISDLSDKIKYYLIVLINTKGLNQPSPHTHTHIREFSAIAAWRQMIHLFCVSFYSCKLSRVSGTVLHYTYILIPPSVNKCRYTYFVQYQYSHKY